MDFTDNLPAGVVIATPANASTTCTGGTITAVAGSGVVSYSGGTVSTASSCTVQVEVTSSSIGTHVNTSGNLTSSLGNSGTATDSLMVISYDLAITKSSVRDEINNSIRYTLTVNNSVVEAPSVVISDTIPNGISAFAWTCTGISCPNATGTGSISESIGAFPAGATVTYNITATMIISTATITNTATVSASNEVNNSNNTAINVSQPFFNIYLPVTLKKAIFAPDLIITSLTANTNDVTVVIQNQGNAAVTDAFWVDVYYTTSAPVLNQLGDVYWGLSVDNGGVPIAVGGTVTLTLSSPYYGGGIPPSAANTTLYGQVDSIGLFSYGAVLESNESNNVFGPTSSTTALGKVSPARQSLLDISGLPTRR